MHDQEKYRDLYDEQGSFFSSSLWRLRSAALVACRNVVVYDITPITVNGLPYTVLYTQFDCERLILLKSIVNFSIHKAIMCTLRRVNRPTITFLLEIKSYFKMAKRRIFGF